MALKSSTCCNLLDCHGTKYEVAHQIGPRANKGAAVVDGCARYLRCEHHPFSILDLCLIGPMQKLMAALMTLTSCKRVACAHFFHCFFIYFLIKIPCLVLASTEQCRMNTNAQMNGKRPVEEEHSAPDDGTGRVASSGKRQKMTKDSHNKDEAEPEDDVLTSILPLRLTTLGGYLPLKDAGRFLLRVSKDMTASIFEDRMALAIDKEEGVKEAADDSDAEAEASRLRQVDCRNQVWRLLCEQKWRNSNALDHILSVVVGARGRGDDMAATAWETLFRKFLWTPRKWKQASARASVEDYLFVYSLMRRNGDYDTPLASYVLKGDGADKFLRTGESGWLKLDRPVLLGNFPSSAKESVIIDELDDVMSTMHALRKSDRKSCELNIEDTMLHRHCSGESNEIVLVHGSSSVLKVGDLEQILDLYAAGRFPGVRFTVERMLRGNMLPKGDGSVDYQMTEICFNARLCVGASSSHYFEEYSDDIEANVTVADFIERLDVEWK